MNRSDLLRLGALLVGLLAVTAVVVLVTQGGAEKDSAARMATVEGVLTEVGPDRLVLTPTDGGAPMTFRVRPSDARRLDLFHLQEHSAQGLPTVVTYEREGATLYAVDAQDAET